MKALILLGGLGTRLRPFTLEKPKPVLPILNRPFISYQLDQLKKHGVHEVVLALGYRAQYFRRYLGNGRSWRIRFIYSIEQQPLGTGGAIRKALPYLKGTSFILNGDVLSDINLSKILGFHRKRRADATLTLTTVPDPSQFGLIETKPNGKITKFLEKPSPEEMTVHTINAGCYVFEESVVRRIPAHHPVSVERDVFPKLLKNGFSLYGYTHRGYWSDIGTLRTYWSGHMDLLARLGRSARDLRLKKITGGIWSGKGSRLGRGVSAEGNVLLGDSCRVMSSVMFRGSVSVGPRCVIGENSYLADCVVLSGTKIGANTRLENCLVGENCRIGERCHVGPHAVLGNRTVLGPYSQQITGLSRESHD